MTVLSVYRIVDGLLVTSIWKFLRRIDPGHGIRAIWLVFVSGSTTVLGNRQNDTSSIASMVIFIVFIHKPNRWENLSVPWLSYST